MRKYFCFFFFYLLTTGCLTVFLKFNFRYQKRHLQPLNSAKKTNLLISTAAVPSNAACNIKKDNLEQEFAKDRSHECKNSTENLEKEVNCKTGTLQKVKKTYI